MLSKQEALYKVYDKIDWRNLKKKDVDVVISTFFDVIGSALSAGEDVVLGNLGRLKIVTRAERIAVTPQTKEKIIVPAHKVVKFHMSKMLKEALNGGE